MKHENELLRTIQDLGEREGFAFSGAMPLSELEDDRFGRWLDQGYAGDMTYMARYRAQREKPEAHFAPYRSVVSFILPYNWTPPAEDAGIGNIARYALGDDYHDVIKKKLFRMMDQLKEQDPTIELKACVDTAPILEKVAAERIGLGWQGKHSNLIREGYGSWFFLAEVLINRDLATHDSSQDRCGICVDCIEACPTRAITAPYVVDSRLCISYLTIELRTAIPRELRHLIGNRIFGCDDCQEVCPWNRFATLPEIEEFQPRLGLRERRLSEWLAMDLEEWRLTFRKSAVKRTKFDGFKRNVAVAVGNHKDESSVPIIHSILKESPALVRAHLIWALRMIDSPEAIGVLSEWKINENDPLVLREFQGELDQPLSDK